MNERYRKQFLRKLDWGYVQYIKIVTIFSGKKNKYKRNHFFVCWQDIKMQLTVYEVKSSLQTAFSALMIFKAKFLLPGSIFKVLKSLMSSNDVILRSCIALLYVFLWTSCYAQQYIEWKKIEEFLYEKTIYRKVCHVILFFVINLLRTHVTV